MITVRPAVRAELGWLVGACLRLNANGTAADPRYRLVDDAEVQLRDLLGHTWFERFQPFPGCLVAERDGERVGFVSGEIVPERGVVARPPTARIDNLWVEPDHRRHGVARALVAGFRARARAAGFPAIQVSTLDRDARAVAFWRAVGLVPLHVVLTDP